MALSFLRVLLQKGFQRRIAGVQHRHDVVPDCRLHGLRALPRCVRHLNAHGRHDVDGQDDRDVVEQHVRRRLLHCHRDEECKAEREDQCHKRRRLGNAGDVRRQLFSLGGANSDTGTPRRSSTATTKLLPRTLPCAKMRTGLRFRGCAVVGVANTHGVVCAAGCLIALGRRRLVFLGDLGSRQCSRIWRIGRKAAPSRTAVRRERGRLRHRLRRRAVRQGDLRLRASAAAVALITRTFYFAMAARTGSGDLLSGARRRSEDANLIQVEGR